MLHSRNAGSDIDRRGDVDASGDFDASGDRHADPDVDTDSSVGKELVAVRRVHPLRLANE